MRQLNRLVSATYLAADALLDFARFPRHAHVLVACMPKSGSTSLTNAIAAYPGFRKAGLAAEYGRREQELCQIRLSRYNHRGSYVCQIHLRNSEFTQRLIAQYRLSPVVLVRDLPDVVMSIRDHMHAESRIGPMAFITEAHLRQPPAELEKTIVRLAIPWYLNFYAGWREDPNAHVVRYEDMVQDPVRAISGVLRHAGVAPRAEKMQRVVDAFHGPGNRLNVGVAGRGRALAPGAAEALGQLLDQYPEFEGDEYFRRMRATLAVAMAGGGGPPDTRPGRGRLVPTIPPW